LAEFFALPLDFPFKFVEQRFIRTDGIDKTGDEQSSGKAWTGEEIAAPSLSPIRAG